MRNLLIPMLVGSLLMNLPGFVGSSAEARLGFIAAACAGWVAAKLYEQRVHSVLDGINILIDAFADFIDESNNGMRLCISSALFFVCVYASVTHEAPFLSFLIFMSLMCSFIWVAIEVCVTAVVAHEARQKTAEHE